VIRAVDGHDVAAVDAAIARPRRRQADPDLLQDHHRQGFAEPAGRRQGARRRAGRQGNRAVRDTLGWSRAPFEIPADVYAAWDARKPGAAVEAHGTTVRRLPRSIRSWRPNCERRMKGELPANFDETGAAIALRREEGKHRDPQGQPERDPGAGAVAAGIPGRLGRPDRLQPDQLERVRAVPASRATTSTTACANSA
jgi:transketolase